MYKTTESRIAHFIIDGKSNTNHHNSDTKEFPQYLVYSAELHWPPVYLQQCSLQRFSVISDYIRQLLFYS